MNDRSRFPCGHFSSPSRSRHIHLSWCPVGVRLADARCNIEASTRRRSWIDVAKHARLARSTPIQVATGEIEAGKWRVKELLDAEAAIILQSDAAVCGGVTELRHIANIADAYGVTLAPHWFHDLHAPLVGAFTNATLVEYFVGHDVFNFGKLIDRQLELDGGDILLHSEPGLGLNFDEEALAQYLSGPWQVVQ